MTTTDFNSVPHENTKRRGLFGRILDRMVSLAEANPRLRRARELNALTDKQLAARGLRREDIVSHVFRDRITV